MTNSKHPKRYSQPDDKSVTIIKTVRLDKEEALIQKMSEEGYFVWQRDEEFGPGFVRITFMLSS
jgi:hypothetical protein